MQLSQKKSLMKGIAEFNAREFFECHETLEDLWRHYGVDEHAKEADRECIQGIIQIAVAYYHFNRGNRPGALKLFTRGLDRVNRFRPVCFGFDTGSFCRQVSIDLERLKAAGLELPIELAVPRIEAILD